MIDELHFIDKVIEETLGVDVSIEDTKRCMTTFGYVTVGDWQVRLLASHVDKHDGHSYTLFTVSAYNPKALRHRAGTYGWRDGIVPNFFLIDEDGIQRI